MSLTACIAARFSSESPSSRNRFIPANCASRTSRCSISLIASKVARASGERHS